MCSGARELSVHGLGEGGEQGACQRRCELQFTAQRTGQWMEDVLQIAMNMSGKGHVLRPMQLQPCTTRVADKSRIRASL